MARLIFANDFVTISLATDNVKYTALVFLALFTLAIEFPKISNRSNMSLTKF